jgi:hypothetical protein
MPLVDARAQERIKNYAFAWLLLGSSLTWHPHFTWHATAFEQVQRSCWPGGACGGAGGASASPPPQVRCAGGRLQIVGAHRYVTCSSARC